LWKEKDERENGEYKMRKMIMRIIFRMSTTQYIYRNHFPFVVVTD